MRFHVSRKQGNSWQFISNNGYEFGEEKQINTPSQHLND
jgi:hypothetical protein